MPEIYNCYILSCSERPVIGYKLTSAGFRGTQTFRRAACSKHSKKLRKVYLNSRVNSKHTVTPIMVLSGS